MTLQPLSAFLDSTHLPAEIVQFWEGSFHFVEIGVNFRLEHQCERPKEAQMSKSENAKSLEERAAAVPTELHERFAQWIYEQTGVRPDTKSVQLACIFRMEFQASDENQQALKARKEEAARKKAEQAKARKAKLEAQLKKLQEELAAEETAAVEPAEKPAPAKKATPAKPEDKPTVTRSRARKAPAKAAEAPATPKAPRTRRTAAKKTAAPVVTEAK